MIIIKIKLLNWLRYDEHYFVGAVEVEIARQHLAYVDM